MARRLPTASRRASLSLAAWASSTSRGMGTSASSARTSPSASARMRRARTRGCTSAAPAPTGNATRTRTAWKGAFAAARFGDCERSREWLFSCATIRCRRYGAEDFLNADGSEGELVGATVADCIAACQPELGCVGFKYKPWDGNKCFLRSYISLGECADAEGQDTWVYVGTSANWEQHTALNCMEGYAVPCRAALPPAEHKRATRAPRLCCSSPRVVLASCQVRRKRLHVPRRLGGRARQRDCLQVHRGVSARLRLRRVRRLR